MKRFLNILLPVLIVSALIVTGWWLVFVVGKGQFALFEPTGLVGMKEKNLLLFALGLSLIVVLPVFTMLVWFSIRYRETNRKAKYDPEWDKNNKLELLWWGIPIVIIVILSVVTWRTSHSLDPYRKLASKNSTIDVQVVALQWKWLFIYPEYGTASVNELAMPVDHPVSFRLTADAPMSAFWIPKLGTQIYSMNGMSSQLNLMANKTGTYTGYNSNINGEGYAKMQFKAVAMSEKDFTTWTKKGQQSSNMLTSQTYEKLAKPAEFNGTRQYMLMDDTLFDTIVMKYMNGHVSEQSGAETKTYNHDMNHMDGMNKANDGAVHD